MLMSLNAYNFFRYREFCEMKPIKYWTDLYGLMPNHTILAYSRIYEDPEVRVRNLRGEESIPGTESGIE
jgi:hypothetical protein